MCHAPSLRVGNESLPFGKPLTGHVTCLSQVGIRVTIHGHESLADRGYLSFTNERYAGFDLGWQLSCWAMTTFPCALQAWCTRSLVHSFSTETQQAFQSHTHWVEETFTFILRQRCSGTRIISWLPISVRRAYKQHVFLTKLLCHDSDTGVCVCPRRKECSTCTGSKDSVKGCDSMILIQESVCDHTDESKMDVQTAQILQQAFANLFVMILLQEFVCALADMSGTHMYGQHGLLQNLSH